MEFSMVEVTREEAEKVIHFKEGQWGDVKAIEGRPSSITEDISALANADGGELFIGIDEVKLNGVEVRSWRGFVDPEAANDFCTVFGERYASEPF